MSFVAWNINNPSISEWKKPTKITFWLHSLKRELWRDNIFWCTKVQTVKAFYIDISYFFVAWLLSVRDLMTFCYVDLCSFITLILFFFIPAFLQIIASSLIRINWKYLSCTQHIKFSEQHFLSLFAQMQHRASTCSGTIRRVHQLQAHCTSLRGRSHHLVPGCSQQLFAL